MLICGAAFAGSLPLKKILKIKKILKLYGK